MIARGFSLLEIMLVLVLVALMLSLGFPLWQHQMRRMHVGEARLALLYNARFLESRLTERQQYACCSSWLPLCLPVESRK